MAVAFDGGDEVAGQADAPGGEACKTGRGDVDEGEEEGEPAAAAEDVGEVGVAGVVVVVGCAAEAEFFEEVVVEVSDEGLWLGSADAVADFGAHRAEGFDGEVCVAEGVLVEGDGDGGADEGFGGFDRGDLAGQHIKGFALTAQWGGRFHAYGSRMGRWRQAGLIRRCHSSVRKLRAMPFWPASPGESSAGPGSHRQDRARGGSEAGEKWNRTLAPSAAVGDSEGIEVWRG